MQASLVAMTTEPLSPGQKARVAGRARMASMTPEERSDVARAGAAAANRPAALARRIAKAWPELPAFERAIVLKILAPLKKGD